MGETAMLMSLVWWELKFVDEDDEAVVGLAAHSTKGWISRYHDTPTSVQFPKHGSNYYYSCHTW